MSDLTEAQAVAEITRQAEPSITLADGVYAVRIRDGERYDVVDNEAALANPRRPRNTQVLDTELSFGAYVNLHGTGGVTHVYGEQDVLRFTAVFDDHAVAGQDYTPGWRDYRAELTLEHGRAWLRWTSIDDEWIKQAAFIDLLEDRIDDVLEPPSTDLLDIVSAFSANKSVSFRSAKSLSSGATQLMYDETITGGGGKAGDLVVPERIKLALDPIKGDDPVAVTARLRWRITEEGSLVVKVKLDRLDDVLELAWGEVVARVAEAVDFPVLEGRP